MLFVPELTLTLETDGGYSLQSLTLVPTPAHLAGVARLGAPPDAKGPAGAICVTLPVITDGAQAESGESKVAHRLTGLNLEPGVVVHAYITVDGAIWGEASATAAVRVKQKAAAARPSSADVADKVHLSSTDCLSIAVTATPRESADSLTQQLHELGIVDDKQARLHQNKVAAEMKNRGTSIDLELVNSGPEVTVADCAHSVFMNQGSRA